MADSTHFLHRRPGTHEWELRRNHGHGILKLLTVVRAVTAEAAQRAAIDWLDRHGLRRRGDRWAKSHGWTDRYALRESRNRHADGCA